MPPLQYLHFAKTPWYAILLQDRFLNGFSKNNDPIVKSLQEEFSLLIMGMTMACTTDKAQWDQGAALLTDDPIIQTGFLHYTLTCPSDPRFFANIWHSTDENHKPEDMNAEQLAVQILYPFWGRMGQNAVDDFVQNGDLARLLHLLKDRTPQT